MPRKRTQQFSDVEPDSSDSETSSVVSTSRNRRRSLSRSRAATSVPPSIPPALQGFRIPLRRPTVRPPIDTPSGLFRRPTRPSRPCCPPSRPPRAALPSRRHRSPFSGTPARSLPPLFPLGPPRSSTPSFPPPPPAPGFLTIEGRGQLRARCLGGREPLPILPPPPPDVIVIDEDTSADPRQPSSTTVAESSSTQSLATPVSPPPFPLTALFDFVTQPPSTPPPIIESFLLDAINTGNVASSLIQNPSPITVSGDVVSPPEFSSAPSVPASSPPPPPPPVISTVTSADLSTTGSGSSAVDPRPRWRLIPLERVTDFEPGALFPIRAHDVLLALDCHPLRTPSQTASDLRARFALNRAQTATVRLMTSSAVAARHDLAATLRRILSSGDTDDPNQLTAALRDLITRLETHPRPELGD
jgi:hypothetical protein